MVVKEMCSCTVVQARRKPAWDGHQTGCSHIHLVTAKLAAAESPRLAEAGLVCDKTRDGETASKDANFRYLPEVVASMSHTDQLVIRGIQISTRDGPPSGLWPDSVVDRDMSGMRWVQQDL